MSLRHTACQSRRRSTTTCRAFSVEREVWIRWQLIVKAITKIPAMERLVSPDKSQLSAADFREVVALAGGYDAVK